MPGTAANATPWHQRRWHDSHIQRRIQLVNFFTARSVWIRARSQSTKRLPGSVSFGTYSETSARPSVPLPGKGTGRVAWEASPLFREDALSRNICSPRPKRAALTRWNDPGCAKAKSARVTNQAQTAADERRQFLNGKDKHSPANREGGCDDKRVRAISRLLLQKVQPMPLLMPNSLFFAFIGGLLS